MWFLNLLISLLVALITWSLARWSTSFSLHWANRQPKITTFNPTMRLIIQRAVQILIYIAGLLIIGRIWSVDIRPLWAGLGVAGIAIALGLQETLSNLFAAFFICCKQCFCIYSCRNTCAISICLDLRDGIQVAKNPSIIVAINTTKNTTGN